MYHSLSIHLLKDILIACKCWNYELSSYKHLYAGFWVNMLFLLFFYILIFTSLFSNFSF